jgi:hypothetical protein
MPVLGLNEGGGAVLIPVGVGIHGLGAIDNAEGAGAILLGEGGGAGAGAGAEGDASGVSDTRQGSENRQGSHHGVLDVSGGGLGSPLCAPK